MKIYAIATVFAAAMLGAMPSALATGSQPPPPPGPPTYGAFAEGGIGNNQDGSPNQQGLQCGGVCYYYGTNNTMPAGLDSLSASGSVGSPGSWGYSSATADLATGLLSVSASANGPPPYHSDKPPVGYPASATAGFFTEIEFSGQGSGGVVTITMGGSATETGNSNLTYGLDLNTCCIFGGGAPIIVNGNGTWSETYSTDVTYGVEYYLSGYITANSSGQFLPGSATIKDPFSLDLPTGVTYMAADPSFLSGVPEPGVWAMMLAGLFGIGAAMRAMRRKSVAVIA